MPYDKEKMKKKDEEILEEMQQQIDEAESAEEVTEAETEVQEVSEIQDETEELKKKLAEGEERLKRLQADFENFRRRTRQEKEELSAVVVQDFIKDLLPLVDNFERALSAEATDAAALQQGVGMIFNQLTEVLKNKGLEPIVTEGAKFDPNFHQAVMRVENPDLEDETIAMELQKGYTVKGKVVRPSMVQVVSN